MSEEQKPVIEEMYHCSICKEDLPVSRLKKEYIDYSRNDDGQVQAVEGRYSVWCGKCLHFRGIADPAAQAELRKITERK